MAEMITSNATTASKSRDASWLAEMDEALRFRVNLANFNDVETHVFLDAKTVLNLCQRDAFGLNHHHFHPDELKHHHAAKKQEHITGGKSGDHFREKGR